MRVIVRVLLVLGFGAMTASLSLMLAYHYFYLPAVETYRVDLRVHQAITTVHQRTIADMQARSVRATTNYDTLTSNFEAADRQITRLMQEKHSIEQELIALQDQVHEVAELEAIKAKLAEEIVAFTEQRNALTPEMVTTQVQCTGSMDPTVTCLDIVTMISNPAQMDIHVGVIIAYENEYLDCNIVGALVMHRVTEVRWENGVKQFRTQGDHNPIDDGCWVPFSAVRYYVTAIEKRDAPEGMALLEQIWAIEKQQVTLGERIDEKDVEIKRIQAGLALCRPVWGADVCPVGHVNNIIAEHNRDVRSYTKKAENIAALRGQLHNVVFGEQGLREID